MLYFIQGVMQYFPLYGIPVLLKENGAHYTDVGVLTFCSISFAVKILWAPFMDSYFFSKFGKRKTYIVPLHYVLALIYFTHAPVLMEQIKNLQIVQLSIFAYFTTWLLAVTDVAIDGWVTSLFQKQNVTYGSVANSVGNTSGWFISQYMFILLNSKKFCNEFIYSSPREEPLVTVYGYCMFIAVVDLFLALYINFFVTEVNPKIKEFGNCFEVIKALKGFWHNKSLRYACIVILTYRIGFAPLENGNLVFFEKGFPKESITELGIFLFPVSVVVPLVYGKIAGGKKVDLSNLLWASIIKIVAGVIYTYANVMYVPNTGTGGYIYTLVIVSTTFMYSANQLIFVSYCAFVYRISDVNVGGTFITMISCLANMGKNISEPIATGLFDVFPFGWICTVGLIYEILFFYFQTKKILQIEQCEPHVFAITTDDEE